MMAGIGVVIGVSGIYMSNRRGMSPALPYSMSLVTISIVVGIMGRVGVGLGLGCGVDVGLGVTVCVGVVSEHPKQLTISITAEQSVNLVMRALLIWLSLQC